MVMGGASNVGVAAGEASPFMPSKRTSAAGGRTASTSTDGGGGGGGSGGPPSPWASTTGMGGAKGLGSAGTGWATTRLILEAVVAVLRWYIWGGSAEKQLARARKTARPRTPWAARQLDHISLDKSWKGLEVVSVLGRATRAVHWSRLGWPAPGCTARLGGAEDRMTVSSPQPDGRRFACSSHKWRRPLTSVESKKRSEQNGVRFGASSCACVPISQPLPGPSCGD